MISIKYYLPPLPLYASSSTPISPFHPRLTHSLIISSQCTVRNSPVTRTHRGKSSFSLFLFLLNLTLLLFISTASRKFTPTISKPRSFYSNSFAIIYSSSEPWSDRRQGRFGSYSRIATKFQFIL